MSRRHNPIQSQSVDAPLTCAATFLVLRIKDDTESTNSVRSVLANVSDITKNVSFRDLNASFACTVGIGANVWDRVARIPRPAELHPFKEFKGRKHTAVSTPGDLLFHIRSERRDLNFEFERQLLDQLGDAVTVVDETVGFRYFDVRDLLGFVDGTANPTGPAVVNSTVVTEDEDASSPGGSYVVVQKYLHDIKGWKGLSTETQASIIGRTKIDNIELDDAPEDQQQSHKSLATIQKDGEEFDILRDNMPFGSPGSGEYGTYFIGYSRRLWVIEMMLERMFVGVPEGIHDRILDYSRAVTGCTFFVPSVDVLESLGYD